MSHRLSGLGVLALAAAGTYFAVAMLYAEEQAGKERIWTAKLIVLLPLLALFGLGMLVGGERFFRAVSHPDHKLTPLGYVVSGFTVALGFGLYSWFRVVLGGLG